MHKEINQLKFFFYMEWEERFSLVDLLMHYALCIMQKSAAALSFV